jgi:hypothetical protein
MAELTAFTPTTKDEFAQLARDRKAEFDLLRANGRWTASVYIGGYIVEARLKYKICELLNIDKLPAIFKTHNLLALIIHAGLSKTIETLPKVYKNFLAIHAVHHETIWRYKASDQQHQVVSDNMNEWLFHPQYGVMTWLGL